MTTESGESQRLQYAISPRCARSRAAAAAAAAGMQGMDWAGQGQGQ